MSPANGSAASWLTANLRKIERWTQAVSPVEAEVRIRYTFAEPPGDVAIQGRLVGPHCVYASTVEVAYLFRPVPREQEQGNTLAVRSIIPEPSFWEPTCPFLYQGLIEIRHAGTLCHRGGFAHGLRKLQLTPRGLRWNGQPLILSGVVRPHLPSPREDAARLKDRQHNTLLVPGLAKATTPEAVAPSGVHTEGMLQTADEFGFLVVCRLPGSLDVSPWIETLRWHPSCLGWLLPQQGLEDPAVREAAVEHLARGSGQLLGAELDRPVAPELLEGIAFICCRADLLPQLESIPRPKLLLAESASRPAEETLARPDILGFIEA